ncbi:M1 family metallopeptidase [Halomonas tibetensis]|uniref:M1 family metallopeptidase n=1 Tax=Halomonas tibetensis TaxID=2259590 RepID=A0ABV7B727_9GAMM
MAMLRLPHGWASLPWALLAALLVGPAWGEASGAERHLTLHLDPAERSLAGELVQPLPEGGRFTLLEGLAISDARCGGQALTLDRDPEGRWLVPACPAQTITLRWQGRLESPERGARHAIAEAGTFLPTRGGWYPHLVEGAGPLWLAVHTPAGQRAVGSGSLIAETPAESTEQTTEPTTEAKDRSASRLTRFYHPRTREVEIAAGPWALRERDVDGVRLRVLFPGGLDAAFGEIYLERAAQHLSAFQARLGRFPFESFSIVASPSPVGLAFPGFTLLGERVIPLPFIPDTSLPHEIMHAWWGAGVQVDYPSGNWAEALTTYLADHAVAETRDEDADLRRGWLLDLASLPASREPTLRDFRGGPDPAGRLIGYQHGALVFHMLRQRMGDASFDAALGDFAKRWMHRTADWQALEAAFSDAAGEDLSQFFSAWRDRPGRPYLVLDEVRFAPGPGGGWLHGVLIQRGEHAPWPLDVPLVVETEDGPVTRVQRMDSRRQPFALPLSGKPLALEVDPDAHLLRHPGGLPSLFRRLLLDPKTHLVTLTPSRTKALEELAGRALGRPLGALPAGARWQDDTPHLVIGSTEEVIEWRQNQGLAAPPSPREALEREGRARFWMHPAAPTGLLSGDDSEALAMLASRLRHHGQRSHLVLGGDGETRDAGIWPVASNPLRIEFTD